MRVLMTGGGTAGHINPALTIAKAIEEAYPACEILFVGAEGRMETRLVPAAGYRIETMKVSGFQRSLSPSALAHNVRTVWRTVTAGSRAKKIIADFNPDLAVGTGGYVCGPILRQAAKMGVPVVVHESNALPGVTVKMLAKWATVCVAEEASKAYFPSDAKVVVTGNPLPSDFTMMNKQEARQRLGLDERPVVLSFGGSLGASAINCAMVGVLEKSLREGTLQHIHAAGTGGYKAMCEALRDANIPTDTDGIDVREYIHNMKDCMAAADLVICRCGAMTLTELKACGKPSILIPSPFVAENHQFHNAQVLVKCGAAECIEEKDLSASALWEAIRRITADPATLLRMGENARTEAMPDAKERVLKVIRDVLKETPPRR